MHLYKAEKTNDYKSRQNVAILIQSALKATLSLYYFIIFILSIFVSIF